MITAVTSLWLVLLLGASPESPEQAGQGSLAHLATQVASELTKRALADGVTGTFRLSLDATRGVDGERVTRALLPRIKNGLREGPLSGGEGQLRGRLSVSEEAGTVWVVVVLEGTGLPGPSTVAVSAALDRELEVALGASGQRTQGRFVLDRVGGIPGGLLDAAMLDIDGDTTDELIVLATRGIEVYHLTAGERLERTAGPWPLPVRRWPRVALGWMVAMGRSSPHGVWVATSAGHSLFVDVKTGQMRDAPGERVPLRALGGGSDGVFGLHYRRVGSPLLNQPLVSPGGIDLMLNGVPRSVRDLLRWTERDAWVFVGEDGTLEARHADGQVDQLAPDRVGDRLAALDIDGDGEWELVTTSPSAPGEPDQLVIRRVEPGLQSSSVVLRSPLSGGSVAAIAVGHIDWDARSDLVVLEELGSDALVWRLEQDR